MQTSILVVMGHPNPDSFCGALARAYQAGALAAGHNCQILNVSDLDFDPVLKLGYRGEQALEPDLQSAQAQIQAASHLVWVYPNWWGGLPALLKGFIDRVFLPGFAFQYHQGMLPKKLLTGRTGHILMTLDTPVWIYQFLMGAPGLKIMQKSILAFSGIAPVQASLMGPQRNAMPAQRQKWLEQAYQAGLHAPIGSAGKVRQPAPLLASTPR